MNTDYNNYINNVSVIFDTKLQCSNQTANCISQGTICDQTNQKALEKIRVVTTIDHKFLLDSVLQFTNLANQFIKANVQEQIVKCLCQSPKDLYVFSGPHDVF